VECTDPLAEIDIPNLIRETGDALEQTAREADAIVFRIRKR
jgi:tRNA 2-thiouridine synthesizing protein A